MIHLLSGARSRTFGFTPKVRSGRVVTPRRLHARIEQPRGRKRAVGRSPFALSFINANTSGSFLPTSDVSQVVKLKPLPGSCRCELHRLLDDDSANTASSLTTASAQWILTGPPVQAPSSGVVVEPIRRLCLNRKCVKPASVGDCFNCIYPMMCDNSGGKKRIIDHATLIYSELIL
jgi:hypothetical protein